MYFILIVLFLSCRDQTLNEINVSSIAVPYDKTTKASDFISKIEHFILPQEIAIGRIDKAVFYDSLYFFGDYDFCQCISVIDSSFNFVSNIKFFGEGPGEYKNIMDFTLNEDLKTIDILSINKVLRYSFQGQFIEEFKLPSLIYKFQHLSGNEYLVYKPEAMKAYNNRQESSILYVLNIESSETKNVLNPLNELEFPHLRERNNLTKQNGFILFSTSFLDTIYYYDYIGDLKHKRYFKSEKPLLPIEMLSTDESNMNILNNIDIQSKYRYHRANLFESKEFIITSFIDYELGSLIFDKGENTSLLFSELENDIDYGLKRIKPILIQGKTIIAINEPTAFVSIYENSDTPFESPFFEFTKSLTINSPLVLSKYHLK
ncbi:hypothetical protein SAMN04488104_100277 [Algoriphagus faecimaris]|uniref:TolB-like 6-blade propeller-like n=1 Tax=Algoriphagus faecimaris TaxID=686796 RepID=A0A1G6MUS8_9BACT|nr:6-bladed beta-propeller [Algoriphagus faecimaris]SDC59272.1 hypothetical protein SAMN04488104_100277 [Algoriphagus faecimaris]